MTRHTDQAANKSKRPTVLTDAKQFALNALSNFDEGLQLEFLSLSISELELATNGPDLYSKIYCVLQIGYFKVKYCTQRKLIAELFGYSLWSEKFRQQFSQRLLAEFLFLKG